MRKLFIWSTIVCTLLACKEERVSKEYSLNLAENVWATTANSDLIQKTGVKSWKGGQELKVYFYTEQKGDIKLSLEGQSEGETSIAFALNQENFIVEVQNDKRAYEVGKYEITEAGYQSITLKNINETPVDLQKIIIQGEKGQEFHSIPKDNPYFGRRGPSVHLNYLIPSTADKDSIEWFYSEIEVPKGQDVEGSYFMANGFGEGYFGMQVNSPTERRVLFSVWSPFTTDDPNEIPDDEKIILKNKGEGVYTGEFGNEGSGGQSFKVFDWKPDVSYKFLLRGRPIKNGYTEYTAYFYAPEEGKWNLIASFERPKTTTYLKRYHSFLENFIPEKGTIQRKGNFKNQWICDAHGNWTPIHEATFSFDATARGKHRFDYNGGVTEGGFYLENCGFFNPTIETGSHFVKDNTKEPKTLNIDFHEMEEIATKPYKEENKG